MESLLLLPAVDVASGQAVRLVQGKAESATQFGDPLAAALDWQAAGATWIHLVDLDAAFGRGTNYELISQVIDQLEVNVQISGGIRDDQSLSAALKTGAKRINLSTAALSDLTWTTQVISEYGDRIAIGLDVRNNVLAARGTSQDFGDVWQTLERLEQAGAARYVVTDVTKDGTLGGPNVQLLEAVCSKTNKPVIASGGISSLADLAKLRELVPIGVEGAITGKALYAGAFTLEAAIEVAGSQTKFLQAKESK